MNNQGNDYGHHDNKEPTLRIWREINAREQLVQQTSQSEESDEESEHQQTVN